MKVENVPRQLLLVRLDEWSHDSIRFFLQLCHHRHDELREFGEIRAHVRLQDSLVLHIVVLIRQGEGFRW